VNCPRTTNNLLQHKETDWEFLKRIASHFFTGVVQEVTRGGVKFYVGLKRGMPRDEFKGRLRSSGESGRLRELGEAALDSSAPAMPPSAGMPPAVLPTLPSAMPISVPAVPAGATALAAMQAGLSRTLQQGIGTPTTPNPRFLPVLGTQSPPMNLGSKLPQLQLPPPPVRPQLPAPPTQPDTASAPNTAVKLVDPSKAPDPNAVPSGSPAKIGPKFDADTTRGHEGENEFALEYAKIGYDIELKPKVLLSDGIGMKKKPDYRIEGELFDCYTPNTDKSVYGIWSEVRDKILNRQTYRVSLNLRHSQWNGSVDELIQQFQTWEIPDLREVHILDLDGSILRIFP
jgi:hypothetical protein